MNSLLIFTVLLISSDLVIGQQKLHVGIYYESLCPDSIRFIGNQLAPNYEHFANFIDIDFVPFGKSASFARDDRLEFECQHGPAECEGNKIQSCALMAAPNSFIQMQFVQCQMLRGAERSGQVCAAQAGLPYGFIENCVLSRDGDKLQLIAERKTQEIAARLKFVPTIVYNHKFSQEKQDRSLYDFPSQVCDELRAISDSLPQICSTL